MNARTGRGEHRRIFMFFKHKLISIVVVFSLAGLIRVQSFHNTFALLTFRPVFLKATNFYRTFAVEATLPYFTRPVRRVLSRSLAHWLLRVIYENLNLTRVRPNATEKQLKHILNVNEKCWECGRGWNCVKNERNIQIASGTSHKSTRERVSASSHFPSFHPWASISHERWSARQIHSQFI